MATHIIGKGDSMASTHTPTVRLSALLTSIYSTFTFTLGRKGKRRWEGGEGGEGGGRVNYYYYLTQCPSVNRARTSSQGVTTHLSSVHFRTPTHSCTCSGTGRAAQQLLLANLSVAL